MFNTLLAIEKNTILICALAAVIVVLLILLLIESGRRKKAQANAARLSAQARQSAADALGSSGAVQTVKETDPSDIEFDPRIDPTPKGVVAKREADDDFDSLPPIKPETAVNDKYENRLKVEETVAYAKPDFENPLKNFVADEPITNGKIYSDDRLLIKEDDATDSDVVIVPEKKKPRSKKYRNKSGKFSHSLFVEESYEPLVGRITAEEEPEETSEAPIEEVIAEAPETENKPSPLSGVADTLMGIASAFSSIADAAKPKEKAVKAPENEVAEEKADNAKADTNKDEKAPSKFENVSEKVKEYADPENMFEKAPYKAPVKIVHNVNAYPDSITVPSRLEITMTERDNTAPTYVTAGKGTADKGAAATAERDGAVALNIFVNADMEKEISATDKSDVYEVVEASKPVAVELEVENAVSKDAVYTVEDATREAASTDTQAVEKKTADAPDALNGKSEKTELQQIIVVEETPREKVAQDEAPYLINGEVVQVRYRSSFMSRLIQAPQEVQDYYTAIKNEILAYNDVKVKNSWNYESFNRDGEQCVKLNVRGRSVMIYLALNPQDYEGSKYRFKDMSSTPRFEKVPMLLSVRTERGLKYASELISEVMKKAGAVRGELPSVDYSMPYEDNAQLALRGLVKLILPDGVSVDKNSEIVPVNVDEFINGSSL